MKNRIKIISCLVLLAMQLACKKEQAALTVTDIDGNVYKTVKIGDQIWMAENLKVSQLNDGTPIAMVTDAGVWKDPGITAPMVCYYDNKAENIDQYGLLYNWYAVNTGKLAPKGWHLPTDAEWQQLIDYLIVRGYNFDGSKIEDKVAKSLASTTGWVEADTEGMVGHDQMSNNKTGFTGLSTGKRREDGIFSGIGSRAGWWSYTQSAVEFGSYWALRYDLVNVEGLLDYKRSGHAVRCIKD